MIPIKESRRFTIYFYGSVLASVLLVSLLLNGALTTVDPWTTLRMTSTALFVAYLLSILISRWLWRWFPLKLLLGIPDVSGRWEGWYWNSLGKDWLPGALEVSQHAEDLTLTAYGMNNRSRSLCSSILVDSSGATDLVWSYQTVPIAGLAAQHRGTAMLQVEQDSGERRLRGTYCTDGVRTEDGTIGKGGFIRYVRVGRSLRGGLGDPTKKWGMQKPAHPPQLRRAA